MLLLILLLLLNVYPLISARDAVFQEKEKGHGEPGRNARFRSCEP